MAFEVGLVRFVRAASAPAGPAVPAGGLLAAALDIGTHACFRSCERATRRYWGHLLTFWGFVGLAMMGTSVGIGTLVGVMHTPLPMTSGRKVFANLSAATALVGVVLLLVARTTDPTRRARTYFDWLFVLTLAGVLLTGIVSEILRLGQVAVGMYTVYFIHLVSSSVSFCTRRIRSSCTSPIAPWRWRSRGVLQRGGQVCMMCGGTGPSRAASQRRPRIDAATGGFHGG